MCANSYCHLESNDYTYGDMLLREVLSSGNFGRMAYGNHTQGRKKSFETATKSLRHCMKFFWLAPIDILFLIPKRIRITMKRESYNPLRQYYFEHVLFENIRIIKM